MEYKENVSGFDLLGLPLENLLELTKAFVCKKHLENLKQIDIFVKRFFCINVIEQNFDNLKLYSKHIVSFSIWFFWGGEPKLNINEAIKIVDGWKTILELNEHILNSKSIEVAYYELKKHKEYGKQLLILLVDNGAMSPSDIKEKLKIQSNEEVSSLITTLEKKALVHREYIGKKVLVTLDLGGIKLFEKYLKPADEIFLTALPNNCASLDVARRVRYNVAKGKKIYVAQSNLG